MKTSAAKQLGPFRGLAIVGNTPCYDICAESFRTCFMFISLTFLMLASVLWGVYTQASSRCRIELLKIVINSTAKWISNIR
jgi:hypothetical protein